MSGAIIDRRQTGTNKSAENRKRFLAKHKKAIRDKLTNDTSRSAGDFDSPDGDKNTRVRISGSDSTDEPSFNNDNSTGSVERVHAGNKVFNDKQVFSQPKNGDDEDEPGHDGEDGEHDMLFELTEAEFKEIMFQDLELPHCIKKSLDNPEIQFKRAGYSKQGAASKLSLIRSAREGVMRRIALRGGFNIEIEELTEKLNKLKKSEKTEIAELQAQINKLEERKSTIPFLEELDLRYFAMSEVRLPKPSATIFFLLDVSGSMDADMRGLSKRFFYLLFMFLRTVYDNVKVRFIIHTTEAEEVDETNFFYEFKSGGTTVTPAYELINDIITKEINLETENVYICQASDGDVDNKDGIAATEMLINTLLPKIQHFFYVEPSAGKASFARWYGASAGGPSFLFKIFEKNLKEQMKISQINEGTVYRQFTEMFLKKR